MCLTVFAFGQNSNANCYRLVLAFNRDEYYAKPTKPAAFWPGNDDIIGGMDMTPGKGGGTWLGLSKTGKLALLLNIGRPDILNDPPASKHRGFLVSDFLTGSQGCEEYIQGVAKEGDQYYGFNLIIADLTNEKMEMHCYCNKSSEGPRKLAPGLHGISNSHYDSPWEKTTHTKHALNEIIVNAGDKSKESLIREILQVMKNDVPLNHEQPFDELTTTTTEFFDNLPYLVCLKMPNLGTRSHTVIVVDDQGEVTYTESYLLEPIDAKNRQWKTQTVTFNLDDKHNS